jgi:adenylate cyclase
MKSSKSYEILLVDDEKAVLINLERYIKRAFPAIRISMASDGLEAWNYIKDNKPPIVISDLRMPKLDGIQLCSKVRATAELKHTYFILLTAIADPEKKIQALELGVDDFLNKPISQEDIIARIKTAEKIVSLHENISDDNSLIIQLANELENEIADATLLALKFQQTRLPVFQEMIKRIVKSVLWIANQLGETDESDLKNLEISAYFSQSGKIFLPDFLVNKPIMIDGSASNNLMYQVPVFSRDIVSTVQRFKTCGETLYHIYENLDGSGFPDRLKSWQIPLHSRILRVVNDYEELKEFSGYEPREAINTIRSGAKRLYDHRIVILMEQYIKSIAMEDYDPNERAVKIQELREGMMLSQDVITVNGLKLLPAGAVLQVNSIQKLYAHNISDPILGSIYVKKHIEQE